MKQMYIKERKPAICPICKARGIEHKFTTGEMVYILPEPKNRANGGIVRVCANHGELFGYHDAYVLGRTRIAYAQGERHPNKIQFGCEVECIDDNRYPVMIDGVVIESFKEACAYLEYLFGGYACRDGSVSAEIVVPAIRNLNGMRYVWGRANKVVDLTSEWSGHHTNISPQNTENAFGSVNACKVLNGLASEMYGNVQGNRNAFGRDFSDTNYANWYPDISNKTHNDYPWAWQRRNGAVEIRLCKFKNPDQYMRTSWLVGEIGRHINDVDTGKITIGQAIKRCIRDYRKACECKTPADKRSTETENGEKLKK